MVYEYMDLLAIVAKYLATWVIGIPLFEWFLGTK
jgi:hypothetical protein